MQKLVFLITLSVLFSWALATPAGADEVTGGRIGFSLSSTGEIGSLTIEREEVGCYAEGDVEPRLLFSNDGFAFMFGDLSGNGLENMADNIDALHVASTLGNILPTTFHFSMSTDCCGMKDGDLYRFQETGGLALYQPESHFITLTGASDGNVDIDAFTLSPTGEIYFSFADNEDSTLLQGSQPGRIDDGDIIHVDLHGTASILYTEAQVSDMVSLALGKTVKIGDVLGLAYDAGTSCLLFTVQSPSDQDASVFSDEDGGSAVSGYDEASIGFSNQVEIDALCLLPVFFDMPALEIEDRRPTMGDTITLRVTGGDSQDPFMLLVSRSITPSLYPPYMGGFGHCVLDTTDALFLSSVSQLYNFSWFYNYTGYGEFTYTLGANPMPVDIHIQAVDPTLDAFSHPVTMERNQ